MEHKPKHEAVLLETLELPAGVVMEEGDGERVLRGVTLIRAGCSVNSRMYTADLLRRDGPKVFEGAMAFACNHDRYNKDIRSLVGQYRGVTFDESTQALKADLHILPSEEPLMEKLLAAHQMFGGEKVGLSISARGVVTPAVSGDYAYNVEALLPSKETSVDIVLFPAAGGRVAESALDTEKENTMKDRIAKLTRELLAEMTPSTVALICEGVSDEEIREANADLADDIIAKRDGKAEEQAPEPEPATEDLSQSIREMVREQVQAASCNALLEAKLAGLTPIEQYVVRAKFEGRIFEASEVDAEIAKIRDLAGKSNPVSPNGSGRVDRVIESFDVNKARLQAAIDRKPFAEVGGRQVEAFHTISEALLAFDPSKSHEFAVRPQRAFQNALREFTWGGGELSDRVNEGIEHTTFAAAWADVLNRHLLAAVADPNRNNWRALISNRVSLRDLTSTHKFVQLTSLGVLDTVLPGAPYQEVNAYQEDQQQTMTPSKYGNLFLITWEALLRDDIGVIARIPGDIANAWTLTLHDAVFGAIQGPAGVGPLMAYDSTPLYADAHGNLGTLAFSAENLKAQRLVMKKFTDPTTGRRKGYNAKYLLYSVDLEAAVWEAVVSTYKLTSVAAEINLPNFIRERMGLEVIEVDYPIATETRWELVADPASAPTLGIGFLGGREVPDVFVQDMETVGSMFNSDTVTYKVRGAVGVAPLDHRSFVRGNA